MLFEKNSQEKKSFDELLKELRKAKRDLKKISKKAARRIANGPVLK